MWWSKVVNRSCLWLRALSRTPRNPWDILFPSCAGRMLGSIVFSLVTGRPSTTSAAGVSTHFVRRLRWYHAHVRLLAGVPVRIALLASRTGPAADQPRMPARSLGSRACSFSTCVRLLDYAGPGSNSRLRSRQCGLPVASTRSAPGIRFSKLDSSPVDASVYASPGASRHPAQDSRSRWFATPFLWGSFIPDYTPVYPDDCACLRARLGNPLESRIMLPSRVREWLQALSAISIS